MRGKRLFIAASSLISIVTLGCGARERTSKDLSAFEENGLFGYRDQRRITVIEPRFQIAGEFSPHGLAAVLDETGWSLIDSRGEVVIRPILFDNGPDDFSDGLARFRENGKIGYFDLQDEVSIEARFDFGGPFHEGLAAVCMGCTERPEGEHRALVGGLWGYIDRRGSTAIELQFERADNFRDGRARVLTDGTWRTIDRHGGLTESTDE